MTTNAHVEYLEKQVRKCVNWVQNRDHKIKVLPVDWYFNQITKEDIPDFLDEYRYFESNISGLGGTAQYVFKDIYWVEIEGRVLIPNSKHRMERTARQTLYQIVVTNEKILRNCEAEAMRQLLKVYHDKQATKSIRERLDIHDSAVRSRKCYTDSSLAMHKFMKQCKREEINNESN